MKIIYSCCNLDPWLDVAEKLQKEDELEPVYWIGWNKNNQEKKVAEKFPRAIFQGITDAWRGIFPSAANNIQSAPLDAHFLNQNAFHELIALKMMDRLDPDRKSFNFNERQMFYRKLLRKWLGIIEKIKPDLLISPSIPHRVFDYALYVAAKDKGVRFLTYELTPLRGLLIPSTDAYSLPAEVYNYQKNGVSYDDLSVSTRELLNNLRREYSKAQPHYMLKQKETTDAYTFNNLAKNFLKHPKKHYALIKKMFQQSHAYLKQKNKKIEDSNRTYLNVEMVKRKGRKYKSSLAKYYGSLTKMPDFSQKYILAALHYQPEATTAPSGGLYADQYLMIDMLSKTMPRGWQLYVKEHRSQFHPLLEGETGRERNFYDEISGLRNVTLISVDYNVFNLLDNALAVATVTGTIGFEAAMRNKPSLVFGNAWYAPLTSVFTIRSADDLKTALNTIENGVSVDSANIYAYLYHLENKAGIRAYHYKNTKERAGISHDESVAALARSVRWRLGTSE
jgi:hypothetical protein